MVEDNILHILKALEAEGYITVNSDDPDIIEIIKEFNLDEISSIDFTGDSY